MNEQQQQLSFQLIKTTTITTHTANAQKLFEMFCEHKVTTKVK